MARSRFDTGTGPTQRQLRVGELVRRTLSDVIMRGDVHDPDLAGVSVTIGEVRMSPDLRVATVYVMPLGGGDVQTIIKALARSAYELRRAVNKAVKLKFSPELRFIADETFDRMDETRTLLGQERVVADVNRTVDED